MLLCPKVIKVFVDEDLLHDKLCREKTRKFSCFGLFYLPESDFVRCKEGVLKLLVTQELNASNLKSERVKQNDII